MPSNPYFVFDGKLCKAEGMTKEQIMNAIAQATGVTPSDIDEGFISTLLETNKSQSIHLWFGTSTEYNALAEHDPNTLYIFTDDTTVEDLVAAFDNLQESVTDSVEQLSGDVEQLSGDVGKLKIKSATVSTWAELKTYFESTDKWPVTVFARASGGVLYNNLYQANPIIMVNKPGGVPTIELRKLVYFDLSGTATIIEDETYFDQTHDVVIYYREA